MQLGVVRFRCTIRAAAGDPVLPFLSRAGLTASTVGGMGPQLGAVNKPKLARESCHGEAGATVFSSSFA